MNHMRPTKKHTSGFIALISTIIISVLLLTITVGVSMTGMFGRFNVLDSESKERSSALAEACVDRAIYNFAIDDSTTAQVINIGPAPEDECEIISVATGTQLTIEAQAVINKAYTNLQVVVDDEDYSIISWEEVPTI